VPYFQNLNPNSYSRRNSYQPRVQGGSTKLQVPGARDLWGFSRAANGVLIQNFLRAKEALSVSKPTIGNGGQGRPEPTKRVGSN